MTDKDVIENIARKIAKEESPIICQILVDSLEKMFIKQIAELKERLLGIETNISDIRETNTILFNQIDKRMKELDKKYENLSTIVTKHESLVEKVDELYKAYEELKDKMDTLSNNIDNIKKRGISEDASKKAIYDAKKEKREKYYMYFFVLGTIITIIYGLPKFLSFIAKLIVMSV